jgi:hypothetical protein
MSCSMVMRSGTTHGRRVSKFQQKWRDQAPRPRSGCQDCGQSSVPPACLARTRKKYKIHARSGFIWRIPNQLRRGNIHHGVALLCGFDTPSLAAQGGQHLPSYFNIERGNPILAA